MKQDPGDNFPRWLPYGEFDALLSTLQDAGYTIIGPRLEQDAICYGTVSNCQDLPRGWIDEQAPGSYSLRAGDPDKYFQFVVGPHSWKQNLFPPRLTVARARNTPDGWNVESVDDQPPRMAFLGVRACELAAIHIQDRIFITEDYTDQAYAQRRGQSFIIAVQCTRAASTCFCVSTNTGPECTHGFDVALTEITGGFLVDAGSERGRTVISKLRLRKATDAEIAIGSQERRHASTQQSRTLPKPEQLRPLLLENLDHPHWDHVAERCLSCTNCTMVCPTCFCSSVIEVTDLKGEQVDRQRVWDSCFNASLSYMNGGIVRHSIRNRYRQWLTHKLATWIDQFGVSGCVGCGRCLSWCPVGIDLTAEVAAIQGTAK